MRGTSQYGGYSIFKNALLDVGAYVTKWVTAGNTFCSLRPAEPMNASSSFLRGISLAAILAGALLGSPSVTAAPATNQTLRLDGDGSYVELPPNLFTNLTQGTLEVWAKWSQFRRFARVFEAGQQGTSLSLFEHDATPDLRFNIYAINQPRATIQAPQVIRLNEWTHIAAVCGPGGMRLYVNGRLVGENAATTSFASVGGGRVLIGRGMGSASDQDFAGEIDELRIWNYPRSATEIQEDMFKRFAGTEPGIIHLWSFDDGTAKDSGPLAANGTFQGKAMVAPSSLGLVDKTAPVAAIVSVPPAPAAVSNTAVAPAAVIVPTATTPAAPAKDPNNLAVWWIAGALTALALVLAWLALMFRRSGLGKEKIVAAQPQIAAAAPVAALPPPPTHSAPSEAEQTRLKERALEELTEFAKESLVQGLFTQRAALLEANRKAQVELVTLEERLANLSVSERIRAYEERIENLEQQLITRGSEVRELTAATLKLLRAKLEEERRKDTPPARFN